MTERIALAPFLARCPGVRTLGVRPTLGDYTARERELLRSADRIFFPTVRYVEVFDAASLPTFPSASSYRYGRSRLLQSLLFQQLPWPAVKARLYFGKRSKSRMLDEWSPPFDILPPDPRRSALCRILNVRDIDAVPETCHPLVVREVIPWEERLRLVSVHYECIAILRIAGEGETHPVSTLAAHGIPDLDLLLTMNRDFVRKARLDDIAVEWGLWSGQWRLVETTPPPLHIRTSGHTIRRHSIICDLIVSGTL